MNVIDPTDYVENAAGPSLKFGDQRQQAKLELGICMAIYKWEELSTAVDNSWGGPNSGEKRDWLSGVVVDLFDANVVDVQLIEETLLYAMFDEFDTNVDNDSALEIAALVLKLYKQAAVGNYTLIDLLYEKWQTKQASSTKVTVDVQGDPDNSDLSDSEDEEEEEVGQVQEHGDDAMEVDDTPAGPVVDDDGFEMVQPKRRGGRR